MRRPLPFIALALLILALGGCQGAPQTGETPEPTATTAEPTATLTPLPEPTPTPTIPPTTPTPELAIVLQDDFSSNENNWLEYGPDEQGVYVLVQDGGYEFFVPFVSGGLFYWGTTLVQEFTDF